MKIKKRIFTEKIEGIPISFFDSRYKTLVKEELKNKFGVYALYDKKKRLYYIGIAQHNIANRIKQHKRNTHKGQWKYFSVYFTKEKDFIKSLEDAFISIVLPKGNIQKPMKIDKGDKRIIRKMEKIDKNKRLSMFDSRKSKAQTLNTSKKSIRKKLHVKRLIRKNNLNVALKNRFQTSIPLEKLDKRNNKIYRATLLKSGQIKYKDKIYNTPSSAAKVATGLEKNGWTFWHFKHGDQWVKLDFLRKKSV